MEWLLSLPSTIWKLFLHARSPKPSRDLRAHMWWMKVKRAWNGQPTSRIEAAINLLLEMSHDDMFRVIELARMEVVFPRHDKSKHFLVVTRNRKNMNDAIATGVTTGILMSHGGDLSTHSEEYPIVGRTRALFLRSVGCITLRVLGFTPLGEEVNRILNRPTDERYLMDIADSTPFPSLGATFTRQLSTMGSWSNTEAFSEEAKAPVHLQERTAELTVQLDFPDGELPDRMVLSFKENQKLTIFPADHYWSRQCPRKPKCTFSHVLSGDFMDLNTQVAFLILKPRKDSYTRVPMRQILRVTNSPPKDGIHMSSSRGKKRKAHVTWSCP